MRWAPAALILVWAGGAFGQAPEFEVASVKMIQGGVPASFTLSPRRSGRVLTWKTTLAFLVEYAYDMAPWQVSGLPSEMVFYDIGATMDPAATLPDVRAMLRRLLADRFQLTAHTETEERSEFALVVGKHGHKLATRTGDGELPPMPDYLAGKPAEAFEGALFTSAEGPGTSAITGRGVPVSALTAEISKDVGTMVLDRTGLTGDYYFGFRFLRDDELGVNARDPRVMSLPIGDALEDELGLRLEKTKGPVDILVVDHVEKMPTPN